MKTNFKNLMIAGILTSFFMVGTQTAKAGFFMTDFASTPNSQPCSVKSTGEQSLGGLLISDFAGAAFELAATGRTGLMVSDRAGLMVSDRAGLLISDFAPSGCH